jgi:hypothetical protein
MYLRKRGWESATRTTLLVCLAFTGVLLHAQSSPNAPCTNGSFIAQPWLEDFAQLTNEMSAHYSDLEYAIQERHMDLPGLRRETETKLGHTCDEHEARQILQSSLNSFGDGHLEIDWEQPTAPAQEATKNAALPVCARLGYRAVSFKPGIDFSHLIEFSSVGGDGANWFPGGILRLSGSQKLGVIRIPIFSEHAFADACKQVVAELHLADSGACDSQCADTIEHKTGDRLTAAILQRSAQLQSAGATAILVDVTHNDGGSDWVESPSRALSRLPLRQPGFIAFIKHEHWTKQLQEQLNDVETDLKNGGEPKDVLQQAATVLRSGISRSQEKCDRSRVWTDGQLSCSLVVSDLLYVSGVLPYAQPGSFASLKSKEVLFHPLDYVYTEFTDRLPLYVVVDSHTWSSAEYFAALLQDNGAATILGEVTGGAGCGYTDGGIPTVLKNSRALVKMPDCIRLRKDRSNDNAGVTPDILVPWSGHDNSYIKATKLFRSLSTAAATTPDRTASGPH